MSGNDICSSCGGPLRQAGPEGVCQRCLLETGLRSREQEIREDALQIGSAADRAAYIEEVCNDDPALRDRIRAWLADPGLTAAEGLQDGAMTEHPDAQAIGPYQLLHKIGEGGFGTVYLAEQQAPVRRRVAVKILKLGMDTRQVVARFELERQALAMMDHPHIAKVFDAGATGTGRPYFAMELVRGAPVTQYCQEHHLSIPRRLQLFVEICQAVQHAHQKGIIHRDLKPSNILVAVHEGVPVPKVIDFGIAKATQQELTGQTILTQAQQLLGTPAYISPEQAGLTGADIDTRSDIYSLGVLLYELLTGSTPFDTTQLMQSGLDELRRVIREEEPVRPSTRVTRQKSPHAPRLARPLPIDRDLDWIVMQCLQKDRARRYATANGLAMDVQRYLAQEPIVARPPSTLYRINKAVRRHQLAVLAATAVVAALFLGAVASTWQAVRATRAEREQIRLRTEIEAELNRTSGEFFAKHGRWAEAVPFYQKAIELTPNHHEFYHRLLPLLAQVGDLPQYQENCRKALAQFRQTQDPRVAERMTKDCMILPNSLVDPEALSQLADLALAEGPDHIDLPWFQLAKGLAEYRRGRFQSALDWLQASLAGAAGLPADPGRVYVQAQGRALLALAHHRLGAVDQARANLLESRQLVRDRLPPLSIHGLTDYWPDWLYAHILLREAGEFIHSPEPILP